MLILVTRLALPGTPVPAALREDRWLGPKQVISLLTLLTFIEDLQTIQSPF